MRSGHPRELRLYGDWNLDSLKLHFSKTFIEKWGVEIVSRNFENFESIIHDLESMAEKLAIIYVDISVNSLVAHENDKAGSFEDQIRGRIRALFSAGTARCDLFVLSVPALTEVNGLLSEDHVSALNVDIHRSRAIVYDEVVHAVRAHKNAVAIHTQSKIASPNLKQWVVQKSRYSMAELKTQARTLESFIERAYGKRVKLIICDLDNTLWGGVIGDDGPQNLRLGGHDPIGEAYQLVQSKLLALRRNGVLLAICSKNDSATVEDFILNSLDMILRKDDFVAIKCNWNSKAENIAEISKELNLSVDDFAFLDDSPAERAAMSAHLPTMQILENDGTPYSIFDSLAACARLYPFAVTIEDRLRSDFYLDEAKRSGLKAEAADPADWVKGLGIRATVSEAFNEDASRIVQLLNKTNQFNAVTRRLTLAEMGAWMQNSNASCIAIRAQDRYGDYGLIGFATCFIKDKILNLVDFVFSCRAMGRLLEEYLLLRVCESANGRADVVGIRAEFSETTKNKPAKLFYEKYGLLGSENSVVDVDELKSRLQPMCKYIELVGE